MYIFMRNKGLSASYYVFGLQLRFLLFYWVANTIITEAVIDATHRWDPQGLQGHQALMAFKDSQVYLVLMGCKVRRVYLGGQVSLAWKV